MVIVSSLFYVHAIAVVITIHYWIGIVSRYVVAAALASKRHWRLSGITVAIRIDIADWPTWGHAVAIVAVLSWNSLAKVSIRTYMKKD